MPERKGHWTVRRALPDDAPACVALYRDWISSTDWMPMLHKSESMLQFWSARFRVADVWVATDRDAIAGFALRDGTSLDALYISPASRRQGLGRTPGDNAKGLPDVQMQWIGASSMTKGGP